jgi:hypothetical protein
MLMFVAMAAVHGFKRHTISSQRSIHVFYVLKMFAAGLLYNGIPPFNIAHKKAAATSNAAQNGARGF